MEPKEKQITDPLTALIPRADPKNLSIFKTDGYLELHRGHFEYRYKKFLDILDNIEKHEGSLYDFSHGYKKYGFNETDKGVWFREWAPEAKAMFLTGDFCDWDRKHFAMTKDHYGNWSIFIPFKEDGSLPIAHFSKVKIHLCNAKNEWVDRIPAWIDYVIQNPKDLSYDGVYLSQQPKYRYEWKHPRPAKPKTVLIYETHIGMSSSEPKIATYKEFTQNVLPRIKKLGYNTIQIMAIMEHSYYGSFGYHVTNFFAISSRFGSPNDLKELIDTAHSMGIYVLMDLVHSHASSNVLDGINMLDGTDYQYFHGGGKGYHSLWDSRIFDYSKYEVQRFLLSNLSWYIEEYRFDGFRFDGVTSMMYNHHGIGYGFSGDYNEYFSDNTDLDAVCYLMLANTLIYRIFPDAITIAEDVSGMPGLCRPVEEGGVGFEYRLAMSVPDMWIKLLKEVRDEDWDMGNIVHTLTNRRYHEKCIAYAESHDQAIVGDKTISMWLFDKEIYTNMSTLTHETLIVNRGIALHKMLRLITIALAGEGYLNFMGNEFGHPEWIDFPREGNGFSYYYCRRQWGLSEDPMLYYSYFNAFDVDMIHLETKYNWLVAKDDYISCKHQVDKIIVFERGGLLWVFNFHPTQSFEHYRVGTNWPYEHQLVLDTDNVKLNTMIQLKKKYAGKDRLSGAYDKPFPIIKEGWMDRPNYIQIYIPSRCAMVFRPLFPGEEKDLCCPKQSNFN